MNTNNPRENGNLAKRFTRTLWSKAIAVTIAILYGYEVISCAVPQKAHAMSLNSIPSSQLSSYQLSAESGQAYKAPCAPGQVTTEANPCGQKANGLAKVLSVIGLVLGLGLLGLSGASF